MPYIVSDQIPMCEWRKYRRSMTNRPLGLMWSVLALCVSTEASSAG